MLAFKFKLTLFLALIFSLQAVAQNNTNYSALVNPFIGTGGHGHTYPGASMPFGMMQLSPDTRLDGWDGCSGYHYSDNKIYGFSHTHLSGTGIADYCDVLLMPFTGEVQFKNSDYASPFSHDTEKASPGFYEVLLNKHQIKASLTTSVRSGMHQYQFPAETKEGKVLLDLSHRDQVLASSLEVVSDREIRGMRRSKSWASNQVVFFFIRFEQPFTQYGIAVNDTLLLQNKLNAVKGNNIKSYFSFPLNGATSLQLKIGISGVSAENAQQNLDKEIPHWNFAQTKQEATTAWNKELGKIEVKGGSKGEQTIFYTALYHASLAPNVYTDVNGDYRGTDGNVHQAKGFTNYSVFSLWDTYRALHPLMTITNRQRTNDWIKTFLAQYKYGGMLPVWELSANETFCMIGYHSVPVIVDAYQKGIENFDAAYALEAMTSYAESKRFGLEHYINKGFISNDQDHESASKTVEYAYDDWCIAQFAQMIGNDSVYKKYILRAQQYKNLFDPATGHIRGKVQGFWFSPFKATEVNNFFTEGNSWHYSFAAPQDVSGMIQLYGGKANFAKKLNELFTSNEALSGRDQADVTGLIGQYAHGNEPSHHMAYLFNYAGQPWRTQELIHQICNDFYKNDPDGLIGNEDCGQMSAWYVLSAMGFYPVTPGSGVYALGTPKFEEVVIHLENGRDFTIKANNLQPNHFYVQSMLLNGDNNPTTYLNHSEIENGGTLVFNMGATPNYKLGIKDVDMPSASIDDREFVAVPYFGMTSNKIKTSLPVQFNHIDSKANIYYSIQYDQKPASTFLRYTKPFELSQAATVRFYAEKNQFKSPVVSQQFYKVVTDRTITVNSEVHPMYTAGGKDALIDGIIGTTNWKTGEWQSYFAKDFEAVVEFDAARAIHYVGVHVLQDVSPWIMYPKEVQFSISQDGINYQPLLTVKNTVAPEDPTTQIQQLGAAVKANAKFIRIRAVNGGSLPQWHESAGQASHLFIDEVVVR